MIFQVGKKYLTKTGMVYTIISTNRKSKDGYNIVAERECTDHRGNKWSVFQRFKPDGKNAEAEVNLVKEYKPKLKVQFTIDLPEQLEGLTMDEIDALMYDRLRGLTPLSGPCFDRGDLDNAEVICSYEN